LRIRRLLVGEEVRIGQRGVAGSENGGFVWPQTGLVVNEAVESEIEVDTVRTDVRGVNAHRG
jgi:hypothetical protein